MTLFGAMLALSYREKICCCTPFVHVNMGLYFVGAGGGHRMTRDGDFGKYQVSKSAVCHRLSIFRATAEGDGHRPRDGWLFGRIGVGVAGGWRAERGRRCHRLDSMPEA